MPIGVEFCVLDKTSAILFMNSLEQGFEIEVRIAWVGDSSDVFKEKFT